MQITITPSDLEPIIDAAVKQALNRFVDELRSKLEKQGQTPGLLTRKEAAKWLGTCVRTLSKREASGELIPSRIGGSARYRQEDLDAYVKRSKGQ